MLATVGATAPFVGLLGTTMGIVNAFAGMAASGSGGLAAISAGVAEALITTAFGLIVAIPAVWAYNYFQTKIDNLTAEMTYIVEGNDRLPDQGRVAASSAGRASPASSTPRSAAPAPISQ